MDNETPLKTTHLKKLNKRDKGFVPSGTGNRHFRRANKKAYENLQKIAARKKGAEVTREIGKLLNSPEYIKKKGLSIEKLEELSEKFGVEILPETLDLFLGDK